MTWFARKIVIFDMFKDVEALGEKQKNSGEKPSKSLEIFPAPPPLGLHSSAPFRRVAHNNEEKLGIYSEIALG